MEDILRLRGEGIGGTEIAKCLGSGQASVCNILDEVEEVAVSADA